MPITPRTILRHELVGLAAEIAASNNKALVGIRGTVVGESRNVLEIKTDKGTKSIPKTSARIIFALPDGSRVAIDGKMLVGRPEKRSKAKRKKW
jgi:ribonuclease P protein subunit POP4